MNKLNPTPQPFTESKPYQKNHKILVLPSVHASPAVPLIVDDERSQKGHFGWTHLGKENIPYIYRGNDTYVSVRMIDITVISKYINTLHKDIFEKCLDIKSYYITFNECRLLSEINYFHCDGLFGMNPFDGHDLIILLADAEKLNEFLQVCSNKLKQVSKSITLDENVNKCGFIKITQSFVPYVLSNGTKFVPMFYFEGELTKFKTKTIKLSGWDLCYLKFLYRIQNLEFSFFTYDSCSVIDLKEIIAYFPPKTTFVESCPETAKQLLLNQSNSPNNKLKEPWVKRPTTPPYFNKFIQTPKAIAVHNNVLNGANNAITNVLPSEPVRFLIPIPEPHQRNAYNAYKLQKVVIDDRTIPCINMKPFSYQEILLICIIDFNEHLFKNVPFHICSSVIQALKIPLYQANSCQVNIFISNNRYRYCNSILPLIRVIDVMQYLPQMKYMLASNGDQKLQQVISVNNQTVFKN
ncbi:uncharacterized protein [Onthophagus taurus]|uniref:uncharacterized protein n=1 Tax=Onthophagus taurus TaxID=166361 RepID=UPI0039BDF53B